MEQNIEKPPGNEGEPSADFHAGFVALIGQPNVGKSTLMNRILGVDLAITTAKPQTTRNRILGVRTFPEKGQISFVDTPGIHRAKRRLNRALVSTALDAIEQVDLICHVVDVDRYVDQFERLGAGRIPADEQLIFEKLAEVDVSVFLVLNKIDLLKNKKQLLPVIDQLSQRFELAEIVPISATDGDNAGRLVDAIIDRLPAGPPLFPRDMLTDQAERFIAAEFIREQLLEQTHQEVPYSAAVEIERFVEDDEKDMLEISAIIHVERDSQKGIVIGKGGSRLKEVGRHARSRMQSFFHRKVFLETFVRVESEWSQDPDALQRFGYQ